MSIFRLVALPLAGLLACLLAGPSFAAEAGWRLVSDKNGIQVYRQDDDAARIKTFRGVTRFVIEKPDALEGLMNDYAAIPRWMHFVSSGEELSRKNYGERTLRFKTELPWPLSDRDVVLKLTVEVDTGHLRSRVLAVDDPAAPRYDDYLRMPDLKGRFEFQFFPATKEVEVTYETVMDPGGAMPAWAANIVLKDAPYFTLLKMRRLVLEEKYQQFKGSFFDFLW